MSEKPTGSGSCVDAKTLGTGLAILTIRPLQSFGLNRPEPYRNFSDYLLLGPKDRTGAPNWGCPLPFLPVRSVLSPSCPVSAGAFLVHSELLQRLISSG
ncbi:hypothetical protein GFM14_36170 [Rhizobium leguminosarum bv. viciae]|nr:hypothetical protein [Rhizobium leguminosarum bv. viciae]